jgi:hypothetical protein
MPEEGCAVHGEHEITELFTQSPIMAALELGNDALELVRVRRGA